METPEPNTQPITTTSSLSLPKLCKKTNSHKIENLIEYPQVPEDAQISETIPHLLSPYNISKRQRSVTRSIRNLISTNRPHMKEYVQSSRLDQCSLRATNQEQYIDLEIPQKNQPVFCKIALLDSSYLHYDNVVIGTVLTTLHAGSVVLTIFPNYNVSLNDNTLSTRLNVQVQITGTDQVPEAMSATLHHQIIYRLQNHSIDLPFSCCSSDSLLVVTNREEDIPSIVQIPRRITREELTQLIPLEWITNYERLHVDRRPIQSQEATFRRSIDKTVKAIFKKPDEGSSSMSPIFHTMVLGKEGLLPPDDPTLVTWPPTGHCKALHPRVVVQPIPCFMYSAATPEYERKFPPLERKMDPITGRTSNPFIHPSEVQPNGKLNHLAQAEEVLNW
ncbi:hypothetical protein KIW84_021474 [Lathyrus oleraceus]|uniref:Polyprotein n=1 Tax=Pisum sativum TaxID=3888 RepID=A0A9D4YA04_PEA|nr:hypothetical protein KIW84_021474 [Pisum sativum]